MGFYSFYVFISDCCDLFSQKYNILPYDVIAVIYVICFFDYVISTF